MKNTLLVKLLVLISIMMMGSVNIYAVDNKAATPSSGLGKVGAAPSASNSNQKKETGLSEASGFVDNLKGLIKKGFELALIVLVLSILIIPIIVYMKVKSSIEKNNQQNQENDDTNGMKTQLISGLSAVVAFVMTGALVSMITVSSLGIASTPEGAVSKILGIENMFK